MWCYFCKKISFERTHCWSSWRKEAIYLLHLCLYLFFKGQYNQTYCLCPWRKEKIKCYRCEYTSSQKSILTKHIEAVHEEKNLPIQKKWLNTNNGIWFWYNTFCKYSLLYHATDNKILMPNIDFVEIFLFYCWNWPEGHLSQEKLRKIEMSFEMTFTSNTSRSFKIVAI